MTILAGELLYSDVAPYLPGTLVPISLPASAQPTRSPWPAQPGAAAGPPPTAVSDRSPAGASEKRALEALVDHIVPGRSADTRGPGEDELRITRIVRLPIDEASATGALRRPNEEPEDLKLPFWGGVIRLRIVAGVPICDGRSPQDVTCPGTQPSTPTPIAALWMNADKGNPAARAVHPITNGSKRRAAPVWFASRDVAQARRAFVTRKAGSDVNLCCRKGTQSRAIGAVALAMTVGALELTSDGIFQDARDLLLEPRPGRRDHQHPQLCPVVLSVPSGLDVRKVDLPIELQILRSTRSGGPWSGSRRAKARSSGVTQAMAT